MNNILYNSENLDKLYDQTKRLAGDKKITLLDPTTIPTTYLAPNVETK